MEDAKKWTAPSGGSRWRGVVFLLPVALFFLGVPAVLAVLGVVSRRFREGGFVKLVRVWGRVPLWLLGVRLEVEGWKEHLQSEGPKLVLFNHVSVLDLLVLAALCPRRPIVMYKKELGRVPGLGWALRSLGMISVDRSDHEAAIASMHEAGRRIRAEDAQVLIAPEGTRSRRGGLQRFKLGAFHMAAETGVPVVPMVMRGIEGVLPMGAWVVRSGVVRVDYLEPIETEGWSAERAREHAEAVRGVFLGYLREAEE